MHQQQGFSQILAILAAVVIIAAVPVGVTLVQQQQELRKSAAGDSGCIALGGSCCVAPTICNGDNGIKSCPSEYSWLNDASLCNVDYFCCAPPPTATPIPPTNTPVPPTNTPKPTLPCPDITAQCQNGNTINITWTRSSVSGEQADTYELRRNNQSIQTAYFFEYLDNNISIGTNYEYDVWVHDSLLGTNQCQQNQTASCQLPTNTPTNTPIPPTPTPTNTPTNTPTLTPIPPTNTPTNTPIPPTITPTHTPTNTPSPTSPPVCQSVQVVPASPQMGDSVELTCSASQNVSRFDFRLIFADGSTRDIKSAQVLPRLDYSFTYTIQDYGCYNFQCRVCSSYDDSTCTGWEAVAL